MLLPDGAAFVSNVRELAKNPDALDEVKTALNQIMSLIDGSDFSYMATIQRESFGGIDSATTLAYHHGLAHQVMTDIITGIQTDVQAFLDNVNKAAEVVDGVDADAATQLTKKHDVLLAALDHLDHRDSGTAAYDHDRNHQRDPWPTATPVAGGARPAVG